MHVYHNACTSHNKTTVGGNIKKIMIHLKVCTLKKCLVPPKSNPWGYMYPQINLLVGMLARAKWGSLVGCCPESSQPFIILNLRLVGIGGGGLGGN